jgi:hypothetical protein
VLPIRLPNDYCHRWPLVEKQGLLKAPNPSTGTQLELLDRDGLMQLSFLFFTGWLFSGILNQAKEVIRISVVPFGENNESSLLVIHEAETHLATPSRKQTELIDPNYFQCPLDKADGQPLSDSQKHLCPVVNKLRYNLAHARPDGNVDGLKEPDRTQYCCDSQKKKLWTYLSSTVRTDPDLYGAMVGGHAFPIDLPFAFLEKYLTGAEPSNGDLGKMLEETLLWYGMAASKVVIGCPHAELKVPIEFHEIDMLLYETGGNLDKITEEPPGGWAQHLSSQSVCLMELTIGHKAEVGKGGNAPEGTRRTGGGKDVPKNKLLNFQAFSSYGFKYVNGCYFSITGEENLSGAVSRALRTTDRFDYRCLAEECNEDIQQIVLGIRDSVIPQAKVRSWHERLVSWVEEAGKSFREKIS